MVEGISEAEAQVLLDAFHQTPLHKLLGLRPLVREERLAVVEMPVEPSAFSGSGNLHGGAIATLIDVACGMAAARASGFDPRKNGLVTADLHVRYLGRPRGDTVRAEARVVRAGRQLIVVNCQVLDPQDRVIASADFSSMLVPVREPLPQARVTDPDSPDL